MLSDLMRASLSMPRGSVAPVDSVGGSLHRGGGSHRGGGAYAALATGRTDSAAALAPVPERGLAEGMHRGALGVRTSGGPVLLGAGTDGGLKGADVSAAHLHAARVPSPDPAKSALSEKLARVGPEAGAAEEDGAGAGGAGAGAGRVASLGPSAEAAARERQGAARLDRRSGRMRIAGPKGATVIETGKESLGEVGPVGASAAARSGAVAGAVGPGELGGACGGEAGGKGGGERETHGGVLFKMLMGEQRQDDVQEG